MPVFSIDELRRLGTDILAAAGATPDEASVVAEELASANLVGHDSHGVMRLVQYVDFIRNGHIVPGRQPEIVREGAAFLVVDAHFSFGQVAASWAFERLQQKAKDCGCANAFIRNCNHVGRLGSYTEKAAEEGFAALMSVNAPGPGQVAPFGAMERRMGTNPISMASPGVEFPHVLDMTTSATAEGKLRVAHQSGLTVPEGWMLDGHGNPSCNPGDYYNEPNGCILPLGGPLAHKGFGLSTMVDVFCGILSGSGVGRTDLPRGANGVWIELIDIEQVVGRDEYDKWMGQYETHIKSAKKRPGVEDVLFPGEVEKRTEVSRLQDGVNIPDETWRQLSELARELQVNLPNA
ncbi:Ldh family oxidoreductase [Rubinisphaera brasiliensis]|uniref:Malate dehydrogenase n=1 Tax=Rubinisphaera brasiliensis (strain ATCC 49424 / DSM 5305 / JCM 21570 / IAM 15109 / NBRC 103401 / IFAM 1448) TaxID=756272 RepID=F0SSM2_RUBBR|nr:Ldh family oxidoreductase [Rubinisphaera brasiliensis]ADY60338.1 Malate dehydrogenase [Rubinisphaera brasiliensis DSM 5305]